LVFGTCAGQVQLEAVTNDFNDTGGICTLLVWVEVVFVALWIFLGTRPNLVVVPEQPRACVLSHPTHGGRARACCCSRSKKRPRMPCRGSCSWRSAASTRASIPLKSKGGCCCSSTGFSLRMPCIPNGGCRGEGALNRRIANHRKRLPITRGSMLLLLLFLQVLGEDADEPLVIAPHVAYGESDQGVVCVLLHKGKHTAHGEVTLHGGPLCDVRCVACVVVRCVSCVVENKKK